MSKNTARRPLFPNCPADVIAITVEALRHDARLSRAAANADGLDPHTRTYYQGRADVANEYASRLGDALESVQ